MKSVLKIFSTLLFIAIAIVISGLFLPNNQTITRIVSINTSPKIVYEQLSNFRSWENWAPWLKSDSTMLIEFGNITQGNQAEMNWDSKQFGKCKLTITHAVESQSVAVNLDFYSNSKTTALWLIESRNEGCEVISTINLKNLSFFERYFAMVQKTDIHKLLDKGLEDLAIRSLDLKYSRTGDISLLEMPSIPSVIMIDSVIPELTRERMDYLQKYLLRFFDRREIQPTGYPFKLVYGITNDTLEKFALGYPLKERTWVWQTLKYLELPEGKVLKVSHYGRPENIIKAHTELQEYMNEMNLSQKGYPWEIHLYKQDSILLDTSLWEIQVFLPIE